MHRKRFVAKCWLTLCAASWLGGATSVFCSPAASGIATPKASGSPQAPLTVTNPFTGQVAGKNDTLPARALRATADSSQSGAVLRVEGEPVDVDTPATYRLPNVSSFAPIPVDAAAGPPPQAMLPPVPPIGNPIAPQRHITTARDPTEQSPLPPSEAASHDAPPPASVNSGVIVEDATSQVIAGPRGEQAVSDPRPERSVPTAEIEAPYQPAFQLELPTEPPREAIQAGRISGDAVSNIAPFEPPVVETVPYMVPPPAGALTPQLLPAVQRGFKLAQRGALYAAQTEFVQVLRRTAQAKDAAAGSDEHSRALAAGLRAIDEAEDFVPTGIQLEADLDVRIVASSHRTPVLKGIPQEVSPYEAVAFYHHYAQEQLSRAAAGEQAGSMALHGLGKIYARLATRNDDDLQLARNATTMYAAALAARSDNHLAANELGVMLCRSGRAVEAAQLFERTIDNAPSALAYHNLAVAQGKLGMHGQAAANDQESQRLAAWERATGAVSRRAGVQWVSPEEMSRVAQPTPLTPPTYHAAVPAAETAVPMAASNRPHKSRWQKTVELAKSLPLPGRSKEETGTASLSPAVQPFAPPPIPNDSQWTP